MFYRYYVDGIGGVDREKKKIKSIFIGKQGINVIEATGYYKEQGKKKALGVISCIQGQCMDGRLGLKINGDDSYHLCELSETPSPISQHQPSALHCTLEKC